MYVDYDLMLSHLYQLKLLDESTDEDIQEVMGDCVLDEGFEVEGYMHMNEAAPFTNIMSNEGGGYDRYFFSSEEITEYYRLVKKIGILKGWKEEDNPYFNNACNDDIKKLRAVSEYGCVYGDLHTKTNHKYASAWVIYVYYDFYDYWSLFFAIRNIFRQYEKRLQSLKLEYNRLLSEQITEVAA